MVKLILELGAKFKLEMLEFSVNGTGVVVAAVCSDTLVVLSTLVPEPLAVPGAQISIASVAAPAVAVA